MAEELGSGGMGEVYLAYTPGGAPVAVKLIRSDRLDPHTRARFEKEALIARTVIGTNRVARFLDADPFAARPWLAMEYVAGRTLLACVDTDGALPISLLASLGALLAEGLAAVHAAGLVHRDLKPQNVMMGRDGPMIIDFGLGAFMDASQDSLSHSGVVIGTVRCMPPEQAGGRPNVTPAADVYALGAVILYAAARHYPYDGVGWEAVALQVANPAIGPDLSGVPDELRSLIASMLAHEPEDRPTLDAVAGECAELLKSVGVTPIDARLALIARTTAGGTPDVTAGVLPPSLEELRVSRRWEAAGSGPLSPLDGLRDDARDRESNEDEGDRAEPELAPSGGAASPVRPGSVARAEGGRPFASQRVADELREQYAASAEF
ncbi:serine/threonine protein kinase [Streptomyces albus]|uniref:Serine/threonine protein kinase n=1 Tax=Streptomyces albus (strain ATCC 21838 / DSM 41398 / FERM P-419 / JCM 4703 / NBRC 107858) TaxID=1081613 RepID=A0A0B5ERX1_STRA4|nr:serine/threonine protein kinase [Streptomyces albus]AYN35597.1 serine/threonine protein kinase [Streptomyces albus]